MKFSENWLRELVEIQADRATLSHALTMAGLEVEELTPLGEGFYLYWYHGKVYESGLDMAGMPGVEGKEAKVVWWKLVRNKDGKFGWTQSDRFRNVDACG